MLFIILVFTVVGCHDPVLNPFLFSLYTPVQFTLSSLTLMAWNTISMVFLMALKFLSPTWSEFQTPLCNCLLDVMIWMSVKYLEINTSKTKLLVFCHCSYLSSVQFSHSVVSDSLWPHESQHARPPCPSPSPGVHTNSRPSSRWCHPAISSSVVPFSSCPQSLPASESFTMSQLFACSGQSTGVSALSSFLPKKSQGWSPSEWTGWISLQSKGLSNVFSNTTIQKHQFFRAQPSSQSNSHIHTWPLEKP